MGSDTPRLPGDTHQPQRGSDVEAYIKRWRDLAKPHSMIWYALDNMLDDYRLHADTGTPLTREVLGAH